MHTSPIAVFAYKRTKHVVATLKSLQDNHLYKNSPLYIFCDGAKNAEDQMATDETRRAIQQTVGESATIFHSITNKGLAASIVDGVTQLTSKYGRVIVMEDDLISSPNLLTFFNQALDEYENNHSVFQISGHSFLTSECDSQLSSLLLPIVTSWGWATWERAWKKYSPDLTAWLGMRNDRETVRRINLYGNYDYDILLDLAVAGKIDSWAIRFYMQLINNNGLSLFPRRSLIQNIGHDGSGTHGHSNVAYQQKQLGKLPDKIKFNWPTERASREEAAQFFNSIGKTQKTWFRYLRRLHHQITYKVPASLD